MNPYREPFWQSVRRGIRNMPAGLRVVVLATVAAYLFQVVVQIFGGPELSRLLTSTFGLAGQWQTTMSQPWRLLTYLVLHGGAFHLLFNLLWLWWMGKAVEDVVGSKAFLGLYLFSGVGGALVNMMVQVALGTVSSIPTIGASGAVFGVMVAFARLYPTMPIQLFLFPPIQARYLVAGLIALDVLLLTADDHVARVVHLGGALSGFVFMWARETGWTLPMFLRKGTRKPKNRRMRAVADAEILHETTQADLDRILDKIAKNGYSSLSEHEKRILFDHSAKS